MTLDHNAAGFILLPLRQTRLGQEPRRSRSHPRPSSFLPIDSRFVHPPFCSHCSRSRLRASAVDQAERRELESCEAGGWGARSGNETLCSVLGPRALSVTRFGQKWLWPGSTVGLIRGALSGRSHHVSRPDTPDMVAEFYVSPRCCPAECRTWGGYISVRGRVGSLRHPSGSQVFDGLYDLRLLHRG